jgi:hypothetical protein
MIGVVAGVGSGIAWVHENASSGLIYGVAFVALAVSELYVGWLVFGPLKRHYKRWHWRLFIGVQLAASILIFGLVSWRASTRVTDYVLACVFVALGAIPIFGLSYQLDRDTHKQCLMCCERIKAGARICRFCGSRAEKSESRVTASLGASSPRS